MPSTPRDPIEGGLADVSEPELRRRREPQFEQPVTEKIAFAVSLAHNPTLVDQALKDAMRCRSRQAE